MIVSETRRDSEWASFGDGTPDDAHMIVLHISSLFGFVNRCSLIRLMDICFFFLPFSPSSHTSVGLIAV